MGNKKCRHLKATIEPHHNVGFGYCPDCGKNILVCDIFNGFLDELKDSLKKLKGEK